MRHVMILDDGSDVRRMETGVDGGKLAFFFAANEQEIKGLFDVQPHWDAVAIDQSIIDQEHSRSMLAMVLGTHNGPFFAIPSADLDQHRCNPNGGPSKLVDSLHQLFRD